jgi:hypothetical protein
VEQLDIKSLITGCYIKQLYLIPPCVQNLRFFVISTTLPPFPGRKAQISIFCELFKSGDLWFWLAGGGGHNNLQNSLLTG